jgi:hypothetical protein
MAEGAKERQLREIFGLGLAARHAETESKNRLVQFAEQAIDRRAVAGDGGLFERRLRILHQPSLFVLQAIRGPGRFLLCA